MTDPQDQTTDKVLTDPQAMVNDALGTPTPTTDTPVADTPTTPVEPTEPPTPAPLPPLEPLSPPPAPETPTTPTPEASLPPLSPITPPMAETSVPMGDDTPLAFAIPTPSMSTTTTSTTTQTIEPIPGIVPPAPAPVAPKPKAKSKVMFVVLGIFALLGTLGVVGYEAYVRFGTPQGVEVALVKPKDADESTCHGCSAAQDGGNLVWRNGACKVTGICNSTKGHINPDTGKSDKDTAPPPSANNEVAASGGGCGHLTGYTFCGGAINKCVKTSAISALGTANGGGCNNYGLVVHQIPITYGSNPGRGSCEASKVTAGLATTCTCGSKTYCFDRRGDCLSTTIQRSDGTNVNTGLCGVVGSTTSDGIFHEYDGLFNPDGTLKYKYNCDANGCDAPAGCSVNRYTCSGQVTGNSCTNTSSAYIKDSLVTGTSQRFTGKCGTVEQIDVQCGSFSTTRTKVNPECEKPDKTPTPSTPTTLAPSMSCTGISKTPDTTPVIGTVLTFTCAGQVTPASAGALTYKFRVSKDGGAATAMTNATTTTAKLTIDACGTYKVQCQACTTLNGVLTCDPDWVGATQ